MRKPIQLHNHDGDLYALCDDGTIWQMTGNGWAAVEPVPLSDAYAEGYRDGHNPRDYANE